MVPVLFMVLILGGLSAAFLTEGLGDRAAVRHVETSLKALELAETGLQRAQMEIFSLSDPDGDGVGTVSGELGGGRYDVVCAQDPNYPDRWTARAIGEHGHSVRQIEVGVRRRADAYFVEGLYAKEQMTLNGDIVTDSFDSGKGDWASQAKNWDSGGQFANIRGHIGSNEGIELLGSTALVRGNAIPGPGFEAIAKNGTIMGDRVPRKVVIDLPAPDRADFEQAYAANANATLTTPLSNPSGNVNLKSLGYDASKMSLTPNGDVILSGGTYFFSDIKLVGLGRLLVKGPTKIYVSGSIDMSGQALVNESGVPGDLQIYASPYGIPPGFLDASPAIKVAGGAHLNAAVYAPDHEIDLIGGGELYGALIGKEIKVGGDAYFHYDEALGTLVGATTVTLERLYWRDVTNSPR